MSNVFRPEYRELTEEERMRVDDIKIKAQELYDLVEGAIQRTPSPEGRYISLAKTSLEESVMWAVKGITTRAEIKF